MHHKLIFIRFNEFQSPLKYHPLRATMFIGPLFKYLLIYLNINKANLYHTSILYLFLLLPC